MKKTEKRLITLSDGTGMGGELLVIRTDAPAEVLSELEKISCEIFINGSDAEKVPIWADVLKEKGYEFTYIDSCIHVTPYGTSGDWVEETFGEINEKYVIEDQPDLFLGADLMEA
ncbi:hypothetical protein [uncultured Eubacterium sp.]|uniref:hypothetical protein n=1 Tax=uncultured Eubacterium sp. TaxID=165185 RepID=UPI0025913FE9|nr:hypothetical protein [uncultured Eubacterium sp.]